MAPAVVDRDLSRLTLRALSALVMAPIAAGAVLLGWPYFDFLVAAGSVVLGWEWNRLCGSGRFGLVGCTLVGTVLVSIMVASLGHGLEALVIALVGAFLVYRVALAQAGVNAIWHAAGTLYLAVPAVALLWLRTGSGGYVVLWLFFAVWATDMGAYAAGQLIGGPHLAPRLSPNKTWAGLLGGIATAATTGALFGQAVGIGDLGFFAGLSAVIAIVAQIGDLLESAFKRHFKVKDTSGLIPGHGGLLDRVDGLLAAAPAAALIQLASGGSVLAWR